MLRNAEVSAKGVLPICQDTGTAIIHGEKGREFGQTSPMKKRSAAVSTTPILRTLFVILRTLL